MSDLNYNACASCDSAHNCLSGEQRRCVLEHTNIWGIWHALCDFWSCATCLRSQYAWSWQKDASSRRLHILWDLEQTLCPTSITFDRPESSNWKERVKSGAWAQVQCHCRTLESIPKCRVFNVHHFEPTLDIFPDPWQFASKVLALTPLEALPGFRISGYIKALNFTGERTIGDRRVDCFKPGPPSMRRCELSHPERPAVARRKVQNLLKFSRSFCFPCQTICNQAVNSTYQTNPDLSIVLRDFPRARPHPKQSANIHRYGMQGWRSGRTACERYDYVCLV